MSLARSAAAVAVHAYTASGALLGWLALRSAWDHDPRTALLWLSLAVFVDATDGFAARAVDVRRYASWIDGARLDDIVDFLTYVFVPLAILWDQQLLGGVSGLIAVGRRPHRERPRLLQSPRQDARPFLHGMAVLLEPGRGVLPRLAVLAGHDHRAADRASRSWCSCPSSTSIRRAR